jgi:hypothetical protein
MRIGIKSHVCPIESNCINFLNGAFRGYSLQVKILVGT